MSRNRRITKGLLSACVCVAMTLSAPLGTYAKVFADENFDNGTTSIRYRKNTANGTVTDSSSAISNGVFVLTKNPGDGISMAYSEFAAQTEGIVTLKADIKSNITDGTLFKMSSVIMGDGASVIIKDGRLVLVCGGSEVDAGAFSVDTQGSYRMDADIENKCVTLYVNGSRMAGIQNADVNNIGYVSFAVTGDAGYIALDNISIYNDYVKQELFSDISQCDGKDAILSLVERGIMKGMGDGTFSPDTSLTRAQMAQIITNALGLKYNGEPLSYSDVSGNDWYNYAVGAVTVSGIMNGMEDGTFRPNDLLTFEQVNKILVESAQYAGISSSKYGFSESFEKIYVSTELTDEESVRYDSDTLGIGSLVVFQNIDLPSVGEYGSEITWTSNSEFVTADGKVTRPDEMSESAVLTAHIKKGDYTQTKDFTLSIMPCNVSWHETATSNTHSEPLLEQSGDKINISYDIVPGEDKLNTVMSFSAKNANLVSFAEMPVIVRLSESGVVDAYNKNTYTADKAFHYKKGVKITINVEIDVVNKCYSVWAKEGTAKEVQIASNYAYRATAAPVTTVGKMYIKRGSGTVPGTVEVTKMSIAAPEGIVNADKYLFDRNYASGKDASDVLSFLREGTKILPGTQLPKVTGGGKEIIWISSDPELITDKGTIAEAGKNEVFTLTAVVKDKSPNSHSLITNKDAISDWAFGYVATAMNMGVVENILAEESFNPKMPITREYAAILVDRLLNIM